VYDWSREAPPLPQTRGKTSSIRLAASIEFRLVSCDAPAALYWLLLTSGVGTMGTGRTLYPQVQDLYPLYSPSQRCGLCQNFKQTTLTTRLYKVRTNLYPPHLRKRSDAPVAHSCDRRTHTPGDCYNTALA